MTISIFTQVEPRYVCRYCATSRLSYYSMVVMYLALFLQCTHNKIYVMKWIYIHVISFREIYTGNRIFLSSWKNINILYMYWMHLSVKTSIGYRLAHCLDEIQCIVYSGKFVDVVSDVIKKKMPYHLLSFSSEISLLH